MKKARTRIIVALAAASLALAVSAAGRYDTAQQDVGQADRARLEKAHNEQAAVFSLCGPQLSNAAVLRRPASAHLVLDGRGRVRLSPQPEGRLPLFGAIDVKRMVAEILRFAEKAGYELRTLRVV